MPIIAQVIPLSKTLFHLIPAQRRTACGHKGAHKHGSFCRYVPGNVYPAIMIWIPRFLCLFCGKTYCVLPFCFLRRISISLPDLVALTNSGLSWDALLEKFEISRNTLWRWRNTGKKILKFLPELLGLINVSWQILSRHLSHLQYPRLAVEAIPTIPLD